PAPAGRHGQGGSAGRGHARRPGPRDARPGGGGVARAAPTRAVQGQGHEVRRREDPPEGRQGGRRRSTLMTGPVSHIARARRPERVRRSVRGSETRPRLSVFRSGKHIYAQVITDAEARTLLAVSTLTPELRTQLGKTATVAAAKEVGKLVARRCQEK